MDVWIITIFEQFCYSFLYLKFHFSLYHDGTWDDGIVDPLYWTSLDLVVSVGGCVLEGVEEEEGEGLWIWYGDGDCGCYDYYYGDYYYDNFVGFGTV